MCYYLGRTFWPRSAGGGSRFECETMAPVLPHQSVCVRGVDAVSLWSGFDSWSVRQVQAARWARSLKGRRLSSLFPLFYFSLTFITHTHAHTRDLSSTWYLSNYSRTLYILPLIEGKIKNNRKFWIQTNVHATESLKKKKHCARTYELALADYKPRCIPRLPLLCCYYYSVGCATLNAK